MEGFGCVCRYASFLSCTLSPSLSSRFPSSFCYFPPFSISCTSSSADGVSASRYDEGKQWSRMLWFDWPCCSQGATTTTTTTLIFPPSDVDKLNYLSSHLPPLPSHVVPHSVPFSPLCQSYFPGLPYSRGMETDTIPRLRPVTFVTHKGCTHRYATMRFMSFYGSLAFIIERMLVTQ